MNLESFFLGCCAAFACDLIGMALAIAFMHGASMQPARRHPAWPMARKARQP